MVVAADLQRSDEGNIIVGYETARVCNMAARLYKALPNAYVVATAGISPKFKVPMGDGPMRTYLERSDVPANRIYTSISDDFRTVGEMRALARLMWEKIQTHPDDTFEIYLVARWWHYPRSWLLLWKSLEPWQRMQVTNVHAVRVMSFPSDTGRLVMAVAKEVFLAWPRNIPELFTSHDLEDCPHCDTIFCYEMPRNQPRTDDHCHRCGHHSSIIPFRQAV